MKLRWLEAQIQAGLGHEHQLEEELLEVTRGFEEEGLYYKGALAALDWQRPAGAKPWAEWRRTRRH